MMIRGAGWALAALIASLAGPAQTALAQTTPAQTPPPAAAPVQPADPADASGFGEEVTLAARPALILPGQSGWDDLYGTLRKFLDQINGLARAHGLVVAGAPMVRFLSSTDEQVTFEAILPVVGTTGDVARLAPARAGATPAGQALRFTHQGGYDTIEQTYDEIAQFLDERSIQAEDTFVEEYSKDPETTPETELVTNIYVFRRP